jgi:polyisoprenoid-binding protein YceI
VADMNAITVTDIPPHETEAIQNLTNHLKSDFDTKRFPLSKFYITSVSYTSADRLLVSGNLTIKDVTKNITIPAIVASVNGNKKFTTVFKFNRFYWNIGADGSWLEKRLVDKEIELKIELLTN